MRMLIKREGVGAISNLVTSVVVQASKLQNTREIYFNSSQVTHTRSADIIASSVFTRLDM